MTRTAKLEVGQEVTTTKTGDAVVTIEKALHGKTRSGYLVTGGHFVSDREITATVETIDTSPEAQRALWAQLGIDIDTL